MSVELNGDSGTTVTPFAGHARVIILVFQESRTLDSHSFNSSCSVPVAISCPADRNTAYGLERASSGNILVAYGFVVRSFTRKIR